MEARALPLLHRPLPHSFPKHALLSSCAPNKRIHVAQRSSRRSSVVSARARDGGPGQDTPAAAHEEGAIFRHMCDVLRKAAVSGLVALQIVAPIPIEVPSLLNTPPLPLSGGGAPAHAVLLSPDTKVPRNAEVALRRAVPVVNQNLRKIQDGLEEIFVLLRIPQRKPYGSMESTVKKALALGEQSEGALVAAVAGEKQEEAKELLEGILRGKRGGLPGLLEAVLAKDADAVSVRLALTLDKISQLAVLQAPGLPFAVPAQFADFPKLTGRAVVEFTVLKKDGGAFVTENGASSTATGRLLAVLDGYSAPLTAGNFSKMVLSREYDGTAIKATQQAVIGDARDSPSIASSAPELPLELMPSGEFQPVYRTALEVSDGELPVLPMSVFGAMVMSHGAASDSLNSPSQFFFYLYDKRNSGLGGLAFEEGQFSVFGYVTEGKDILSQLRTGDVIQSARLISGADRLVLPED